MTSREMWCNNPAEHGQHWLEKSLRCDGVTPDEAALLALLLVCWLWLVGFRWYVEALLWAYSHWR